MNTFTYYVGWAILVVGVCFGLYLGGTLYGDPLRWVYGLGMIFSSAFFGLVLIAVSNIYIAIQDGNENIESLKRKVAS